MSSSPATSTTSVLLSKDSGSLPQPQKDYASAFASLQSSFGANGHAPVLPPRDTHIANASEAKSGIAKNTPRQSRWGSLFRTLRSRKHSDSVHRIERDAPKCIEEAVGTSGTNAAGIVPQPEEAPQSASSDVKKDFNAAFATLQTSYGVGGLSVGASR
jgi:hypothetical protein